MKSRIRREPKEGQSMKIEIAKKNDNKDGFCAVLTGTSGNMGREALKEIMTLDCVKKVKLLLTERPKNTVYAARLKRRYGEKLEIYRGSLADESLCEKLVEKSNLVINMAAVIPPKSDKFSDKSYECNVLGVKALVEAMKKRAKNAALIHISSVAVYGNRTMKNPFGRTGDPLMPSPYDNYALHKCIGERFVMESGLDFWCVIRQTAMLHENIMKTNIKDGLMFHTPLNAPLEWVTARDSGVLMKRIAEAVANGKAEPIRRKVFNLSGGSQNRLTGYETYAQGFSIIGGTPEKFFKPNWFATRNFHGMWFYDNELEDLFRYQNDTTKSFWADMQRKHKLYSLAKILPAETVSKIVFNPLLDDENAPTRWIKDRKIGKVNAYFGSFEKAKELSEEWDKTFVWCKQDGYEESKTDAYAEEHGLFLDHGYDESKPMEEWDIEDMKKAAEFRGGKCLSVSMVKGDAYAPLKWVCHDGHEFTATPYTVLKGGHWCDECEKKENYSEQAKYSRFMAQVVNAD